MKTSRALVTAGLLVVSGAVLAGCLASGRSTVRTSGQYVSGRTLALIEEGTSTERELLDLLGSPTRTMHHHDGRTVHVYSYRMDARASGGVFIFVAGSSRERVERTTYFEVRDGVVSRYWTDGASQGVRRWAEECDVEMDDEDWEEFEGLEG